MNMWLTYGIIAVVLVIAELVYFRIADKCNIIDKPNATGTGHWHLLKLTR